MVTEIVAPAAVPQPSRQARRVGAALLGGALLGLLVAALLWWPRAPVARPSPAPERALGRLALRRISSVPPDVTRLLVARDDTLVMAGSGALYLQSTREAPSASAADAPLRVALPAGHEVVGTTSDGDLFVADTHGVLRLDPLQQKSSPWIEHLRRPRALAPTEPGSAAVGRVLVSPSGLYVALVGPGRIEVCARPAVAPVCVPAFEAPWDTSAGLRLALSDRYLAVAQGQRTLDVYRTAGGRRVRHTALPDPRVHDVALLDDVGQVAVAGWYPRVDVFPIEGESPAIGVPRQGPTVRLAWIRDRPTLLAGGPAGLHLWRRGGAFEEVTASGLRGLAREGQGAGDLLVAPGLIAALNGDDHVLALYDYDSLGATRRALGTDAALWALATEADGSRVYAGSSRGPLHALDVTRDSATTLALHADGITDLALQGGALASCSDDKTVAVWQLPKLEVSWRTRAHGFLVNQLTLAGQPPALWTSSSDGSVKRWGWPQPEPQEQLDTRRLVPGQAWALHALWVAPSGNLVLAGTWQRALLELRRDERGVWSGRRWPVDSQVLYRAIDVPSVDAVVFVGLSPHMVWVYDRRTERVSRLPSFGHLVNSGSAGATPGEVYVAGLDAVLRYRLKRAPDGALDGDFTAALDTRLGTALSAAWLARPGAAARLVLGQEQGTLVFVDPRALDHRQALPLRPVDLSSTTPAGR